MDCMRWHRMRAHTPLGGAMRSCGVSRVALCRPGRTAPPREVTCHLRGRIDRQIVGHQSANTPATLQTGRPAQIIDEQETYGVHLGGDRKYSFPPVRSSGPRPSPSSTAPLGVSAALSLFSLPTSPWAGCPGILPMWKPITSPPATLSPAEPPVAWPPANNSCATHA